MPNTSQKVPLARTLNNFAIERALDAIELTGKALPASVVAVSGSIVTVKFEIQSNTITLPNVTIPKLESQWMRGPTQRGDQGLVVPSDVSLGAVSGLGGASAATLNLVPNLSALGWLPVANSSWEMDDSGKALINGPTGVILRTEDKAVTFTLNETTVTIVGSGSALALVTAAFQTLFNTHTHPANGQPPTQQMTSAQLTTVLNAE